MDRIIRQITDAFVAKLPEDENYYRIQNLHEYGFPSFVIKRMHIELEWNLDESMQLPRTDWANTESQAVQQSWQHFLQAIHAEVQLPASYARAVIETAVADIVEIIVQPRKNIPEIIYGGEEKLTKEELAERTELLVVYAHFGRVLTAYMERKGREELERAHCKKIINDVDEKLTGNYTPLQWAQMLDALFELAGNAIDTNIFRLFFEDKDKLHIARQFDLMDDTITRATFIEILSSPELLNYAGYEPDQSELFNAGEKSEQEDTETLADSYADQPKKPLDEPDVEATLTEPEQDNPKTESIPVNDDIKEDQESDFAEIPENLDEEKNEEEQIISEEKSSDSLNAIFVDEEEQEENVEEEQPEPEQEIEETQAESISENVENQEPEGPAVSPIWQRFMQDEEGQDEVEEEPIIDFTSSNENADVEQEGLERLLQDEKTYFVEELFGGSEQGYEESLREIAQKDDWKSASKLIEKNIFRRNMVDMYSEAAVEFTDRLHTYFINKQNHNKDRI